MPRKKKQPEPEVVPVAARPEPPKPKTAQLHVSSMEMLAKCGVQWEFREVKGMKIAPGIAIKIGNAVDKTVTADLNTKIKSGELLTAEAIADIAADNFNKEYYAEAPVFTADEVSRGIDNVRGSAKDQTVGLSILHHTVLAPKLNPAYVQREFVIELEDYSVELAGTIDIQEGSGAIRDTKTRGRLMKPQEEADTSDQLTTYAYARELMDGEASPRQTLDILVKNVKFPKLEVFVTSRGPADFDRLLRRVERSMKVIESGAFMPARPTDWWCSKHYCGYFNICPHAVRPISISVPGGVS